MDKTTGKSHAGETAGITTGTSDARATTGKSQFEMDLDVLEEAFRKFESLAKDHAEFDYKGLGSRLNTLHTRLIGLGNLDAVVCQLLHDAADVLRHSALVFVSLTDRIHRLEDALEKSIIYRDWVLDFHRLIALDVKLSNVLDLTRALDSEIRQVKGDQVKKWKKPYHRKVDWRLQVYKISRQIWEMSVKFRKAMNLSSHVRGIDYIEGDWRRVLASDIQELHHIRDLAANDKEMLMIVLDRIPTIYDSF